MQEIDLLGQATCPQVGSGDILLTAAKPQQPRRLSPKQVMCIVRLYSPLSVGDQTKAITPTPTYT